jgi:hypothetical protein
LLSEGRSIIVGLISWESIIFREFLILSVGLVLKLAIWGISATLGDLIGEELILGGLKVWKHVINGKWTK